MSRFSAGSGIKAERSREFAYPRAELAPETTNFQSQLLNAIEQAVVVTDLSGHIIYWNRFAERLYGWSLAEAIGRRVIELIMPVLNTAATDEIMNQLRRGQSWTGEFVVRRKDGTEFPAEVVDSPLYDDEGKLFGIVGVSRDISERKRAEDFLRESEHKYRMLIEQASDGIHTYDASGKFLDTNSKLCEMLGYTCEELMRLNVKDLIPPEDLADNPIRYEALLAGETLLKERRLRRKDGSLFYAEISGKLIQPNVIQGIVRDITERKNAEQKLKRSEERLRTILAASHDGILVEDGERIVYINKSYLELFGFEHPEELIGERVAEIVAPEDVDRVLNYGKRRLLGQEAPAKYEFKGRRKDGTSIDVEASVSTSESAGSTYITTFLRDISERKRLETLLEAQKVALEMVVQGAPLGTILSYLTEVVEKQSDGTAVASILLLDEDGCLRNGASPSLPDDYLQAIDGLKADIDVGTCASAAASGEVIVTADIAADPKWNGIAHLPLNLGLVAAWALPIVARDGHVLGTFGTYFRERREPTAFERQVVEILARTAALAIEQKEAEESLRSSENQLRLVTDAIPMLVSFVDSDHRYRFVNRAYSEWFARRREDVTGKHLSEVLGEAAYESVLPEIEKALSGEEVTFERVVPYRTGKRFARANYIPQFDAATGHVIGFHAFVQDVSAQREAEEALHRSKLELEARVKERTRALEKATADRVAILRQLVNAQEDERQRIARDLHDELGQKMMALRLKLAAIQKTCAPGKNTYEQIDEVRQFARQLDADIDFLAWRFRPAVLDDLGLVAALDQYIGQWSAHFGIASDFDAKRFGNRRLDPECETAFYRITQEALNNVYKHARATSVSIFLGRKKSGAVLIVEDDGVGFEPDEENSIGAAAGMGLKGMRERLALIGGTLEIESATGEGTTVYATVPFGLENEDE